MFIKKGKWHEECVKGRGKEPPPQIFIVILRDAFYRLSHSFHLKKNGPSSHATGRIPLFSGTAISETDLISGKTISNNPLKNRMKGGVNLPPPYCCFVKKNYFSPRAARLRARCSSSNACCCSCNACRRAASPPGFLLGLFFCFS